MRQLQKRIENLVAKLATLKANALKTETSVKPAAKDGYFHGGADRHPILVIHHQYCDIDR
jgi:hypothetical protein